MSQLGDALTDTTLAPPVKALVVWNSNPAQVAPDQSRVLAGLQRDDLFTVVLDQFMTDTARYADVVLPVTTQLEHLDALFSWGHHYITYNAPAIAPLGESKPNTEVFRLLAAGLGLDDPCFQETDEALLDAVFDRAPEGITLERLRERGWLKVDVGQGPIPHAEGGFGTPDGKVAFRADWLAGLGLDPLPTFDPPAEVADEQLAARFPLALLTPKTHFFLNSTFANQARQHRAQPEPFVVVHPDDAAARDIVRRRPRSRLQRPRRVPPPCPRQRRCASRRRRRPGELVDGRPRRSGRRPGHDVAATDRAGPGPDVQRHPRRGCRGCRLAGPFWVGMPCAPSKQTAAQNGLSGVTNPSGSGRSGSRPSGPSGSARRAPRRAWPASGGRGRRRCAPRRSTRSPTPATAASRG